MWSNDLSSDWLVFGYKLDFPENIHYVPFDILFHLNGISNDIYEEKFSNTLEMAGRIKNRFDKLKTNTTLFTYQDMISFGQFLSCNYIARSPTELISRNSRKYSNGSIYLTNGSLLSTILNRITISQLPKM